MTSKGPPANPFVSGAKRVWKAIVEYGTDPPPTRPGPGTRPQSPLIHCPDCDRLISRSANFCPGCGRPIAAPKQPAARPAKRSGTGLGCLILLAIFGAIVMGSMAPRSQRSTTPVSSPQQAPTSDPAPARVPKIELRIDQVEYAYGYFKVVGIAKNVGAAAAFSPTIDLKVFDSKTGQTLLGEDSSWPTGLYLKSMEPDASAAFELIARVPGEPGQVKWRVSMDDYPYEIVEKGKKKK